MGLFFRILLNKSLFEQRCVMLWMHARITHIYIHLERSTKAEVCTIKVFMHTLAMLNIFCAQMLHIYSKYTMHARITLYFNTEHFIQYTHEQVIACSGQQAFAPVAPTASALSIACC